jgi:hypothetical protein
MKDLSTFLESIPDHIKYHGGHNENDRKKTLKAGVLNMIYENAGLRYISAGKNEIVRRVYPALRDKNWLTVRQSIEEENLDIYENSFRISLKCMYVSEEINFLSNYVIEGSNENCITITMDGEALSTFARNRIGFCVLHPVKECKGKKCTITHPDGSSEESVFPEDISPGQVFSDVVSMQWSTGSGHCFIDFEGDLFETEDQRNWTDTSFKTYSTPLSEPFPVTIEKGTKINQKIKIKFDGEADYPEAENEINIVKLFPDESFRIPSIGICRSSDPEILKKDELVTLRSLRFDHYRIELYLNEARWQERAQQAYEEATDLGYDIEFALFFDDGYDQQIETFMQWLSTGKISVSSILLFHKSYPTTPEDMAKSVIARIKSGYPNAKTGTGTNANFAEINRNRPADTGNDLICFSIHPQEHSSDNLTLVENLEAQKYTIASSRRFAGSKEVSVSPITLQRRFNPHNSFIELPYRGSDIPSQVDSRLMALFGGCWTAGSMKYLFEAGVDNVTFYETKGERGILQGEADTKWPSLFPAVRGMIFPVFHVFRFLLANKSLRVIRSVSSRPLVTDCLALTDGKQAHIILVNFTDSLQSLKFECCSGLFRIRSLNTSSFSAACQNFRWTGMENERITKSQNIFEIDPFSINFIEGWVKH